MKKIVINISDLQSAKDPYKDLYDCFEFQESKDMNLESLHQNLMDIDENIVVELRQEDVVDERTLNIIDCFENVQQKNDHLYVIQGVE